MISNDHLIMLIDLLIMLRERGGGAPDADAARLDASIDETAAERRGSAGWADRRLHRDRYAPENPCRFDREAGGCVGADRTARAIERATCAG